MPMGTRLLLRFVLSTRFGWMMAPSLFLTFPIVLSAFGPSTRSIPMGGKLRPTSSSFRLRTFSPSKRRTRLRGVNSWPLRGLVVRLSGLFASPRPFVPKKTACLLVSPSALAATLVWRASLPRTTPSVLLTPPGSTCASLDPFVVGGFILVPFTWLMELVLRMPQTLIFCRLLLVSCLISPALG